MGSAPAIHKKRDPIEQVYPTLEHPQASNNWVTFSSNKV